MKIRKTTLADIEGIADIEFDRYAEKYADNPGLKQVFKDTLKRRLVVASDWMWVAIDKDQVVQGCLSAQPTNKQLDDFISWEDSTDNGTLEGTYESNGKNIYVVNLDIDRQASGANVQYMLMIRFAAQVVSCGKNVVFFESRIPNFRDYVTERYSLKKWESMDTSQQTKIAADYVALPGNKGKKKHDKLLNFYAEAGFRFYKVLPNAFVDAESLNYGVICYTKNPIPKFLRLWPVNKIIGVLVRLSGSNPKILDILIR